MSLLRNPPETQYADSGDGYIAYQTFGEGPDVLFLTTREYGSLDLARDTQGAVLLLTTLATRLRPYVHDETVFSRTLAEGLARPYARRGEPFDDLRVSQALAYAIDREAIAQATNFGNATVNQRELGVDTYELMAAMRSALRQDPDVILDGVRGRGTDAVQHQVQYGIEIHCANPMIIDRSDGAVKPGFLEGGCK